MPIRKMLFLSGALTAIVATVLPLKVVAGADGLLRVTLSSAAAQEGNGNGNGGNGKGGKSSSASSRSPESLDPGTGGGRTASGNAISIGVRHGSGIEEELANGRYVMRDNRGRTIINRAATAADRARIRSLAGK